MSDGSTPTRTPRPRTAPVPGRGRASLLHLMVHSVYSNRDVFLRELISNAADACEKLRYEALARPELLAERRRVPDHASPPTRRRHADHRRQRHRHEPRRAGRQPRHHRPLRHPRLPRELRRKDAEGSALIGQFGVGFYSAFMVADRGRGRRRARPGTARPGAGRRTAGHLHGRAGAARRRAGARHARSSSTSTTTRKDYRRAVDDRAGRRATYSAHVAGADRPDARRRHTPQTARRRQRAVAEAEGRDHGRTSTAEFYAMSAASSTSRR